MIGQTLIAVGGALFLSQLISLGIYLRTRHKLEKGSLEYGEATYHIRFKTVVVILGALCVISGLIILSSH